MSLRRYVGDIGIVGYIVRLAILLVFAVYFVVPLVWLLFATSRDSANLNNIWFPLTFGSVDRLVQSWNDILNYQNGEMALWLGNSVRYAGLSLAGSLAVCIPAGYVLAIGRFPGRKLLLWLTLITMLLPISAMVLPMFLELNLVHLVNTQWAVILPAIFFPFGVYLSYVYYGTSLPRELVDAARVDGCSDLRVFWHIALPLAKPLLGLLAFISFNANWNNFFGPYVMLNDDTLYNLPVGINSVVAGTSALRPGFNPTPGAVSFQQADAAMAALFMIVPVAIVFVFSMRYVTSGAFTGGVKG
ncbi:MAG: carbohydrate ABC transporter permease [Candidatus Limnocylindrales bacterium]